MTRLMYKTLIMLFFVLSVYALICVILSSLPAQSTPDIYKRKSLLLRQTTSPRIILIGGSNVLLGIDSDSLEQKMGLSVINMGLNAGFGLKFMTEMSKEYLEAGDIVILSPEYEHLYDKNNYYGTFRLIDLIIDNPAAATHISGMEHKFHLLLLSPATLVSRLIYGVTSYDPPISAKGDFLWNEISLQNKVKLPKPGIISSNALSHDIYVDLISYRNLLRSRNIKLYLSFPYIPVDLLSMNRRMIDKLYSQLISSGFNVLAPPDASTLSAHYFFDTTYHLNAVGRILRTDAIAAQLTTQLSRH